MAHISSHMLLKMFFRDLQFILQTFDDFFKILQFLLILIDFINTWFLLIQILLKEFEKFVNLL